MVTASSLEFSYILLVHADLTLRLQESFDKGGRLTWPMFGIVRSPAWGYPQPSKGQQLWKDAGGRSGSREAGRGGVLQQRGIPFLSVNACIDVYMYHTSNSASRSQ